MAVFDVGAFVEIADELGTPNDGVLYQVKRISGQYRYFRQISGRTGNHIGLEVYCKATELIEARPGTLKRYSHH